MPTLLNAPQDPAASTTTSVTETDSMTNEATPKMPTSVVEPTSNKATPATKTIQGQDQKNDGTQSVSSTIATISSDICGETVTTTTTLRSKVLESLKKFFKECAESSITTFKTPKKLWKMRREATSAQGSDSRIKGGQDGWALLEDLAGEEDNSTGKTFGEHGIEKATGARQRDNEEPTNTTTTPEYNSLPENAPVLAPIARISSIGEILAG